jgi:hypothetical protein
MRDDAAGFTGSIPEHYEHGLGPMIFVDYAAEMARRVAAAAQGRVLETAAGNRDRYAQAARLSTEWGALDCDRPQRADA